jgi:DNA-binding transcriptional LysR family regulator
MEYMEIRELRAFVAVVERGGVSAAARYLHVSQSAVSQTIQALERQLGVKLLHRNHAGMKPTEAGDILVREAHAVIERHDKALRAVTGGVPVSVGALRVGVPLELPADLLPTALAQLSVTHPQTRVEVIHSSSRTQLGLLPQEELDVALVRDRPADGDLDAVLAVEEEMGVILSSTVAERIAEPEGVWLHRLVGLDWMGFSRSDAPAWYDQVTATLRGHGLRSDRPEDERPVTAEVKLAAAGTGRAFAFASPGWSQPLPEGLQWFPLIGGPIVRRTWAVWLAKSTRRDLGTLVAALDKCAR